MKFSDRIGATKPPEVLQTEDVSHALRNSLWNLFLRAVFNTGCERHPKVTKHLAEFFFKFPVDTLPMYDHQHVNWLRELFFHEDLAWWGIYNLIEFIADNCGGGKTIYWTNRDYFIEQTNLVLTAEMSGFRFVNGVLSPITNKAELGSIEQAVMESEQHGFSGVRQHLASAVSLLSQRPNPDYRNSIKESISGVESLSKQITGESGGGLEKALSSLDATVHFHGAFKAGLLSLYGYTSDDSGIRHAILDDPQVGFDEAKFMLVVCSALVNFIIMKATQAGIIAST